MSVVFTHVFAIDLPAGVELNPLLNLDGQLETADDQSRKYFSVYLNNDPLPFESLSLLCSAQHEPQQRTIYLQLVVRNFILNVKKRKESGI